MPQQQAIYVCKNVQYTCSSGGGCTFVEVPAGTPGSATTCGWETPETPPFQPTTIVRGQQHQFSSSQDVAQAVNENTAQLIFLGDAAIISLFAVCMIFGAILGWKLMWRSNVSVEE
jgi:hypothetical protein